MSFQWEEAGTFGSEIEVNTWALRNGIALNDLNVRPQGDRLSVAVRRSVSEPRGGYGDKRGQRDGFY